jgi:hypothetical protein
MSSGVAYRSLITSHRSHRRGSLRFSDAPQSEVGEVFYLAVLRSAFARSRTEGVRFELTRACALPVFKTSALNRSATPPQKKVIG